VIRVGVSGWIYPRWRGVFYPRGLPRRLELAYASRAFTSLEINGTFYSLKSVDDFRRWSAATPDDFIFAVKGSRYITHMKKLEAIETALPNFFASGLLALGPKLGPILWQLPTTMRFDAGRIERFLESLPRDMDRAAALARRHDRRLPKDRALVEPLTQGEVRHALEVRHQSFEVPAFIALLRHAGVALVVSDSPQWPRFVDVTAEFLYLRMHGDAELYVSGYDEIALDRWAARIARWAAGGDTVDQHLIAAPAPRRPSRDVYIYFDNDAKVRAPVDARALARRLGTGLPPVGLPLPPSASSN
jgi:uncharacterized protein YecE (DUF72 family)